MTDRELLEMAAKAAGYEFLAGGEWHNKGAPGIIIQLPYGRDWVAWNPLTSDGDALRLAVGLGIIIYPDDPCSPGYAFARSGEIGSPIEHDHDKCASARRAIVRAAAEIGKAMP